MGSRDFRSSSGAFFFRDHQKNHSKLIFSLSISFHFIMPKSRSTSITKSEPEHVKKTEKMKREQKLTPSEKRIQKITPKPVKPVVCLPNQFEDNLQSLGYAVEHLTAFDDGRVLECIHDPPRPKTHCLFLQNGLVAYVDDCKAEGIILACRSDEIRNSAIPWTRQLVCKECLKTYLDHLVDHPDEKYYPANHRVFEMVRDSWVECKSRLSEGHGYRSKIDPFYYEVPPKGFVIP
jgi:hypothetical protein